MDAPYFFEGKANFVNFYSNICYFLSVMQGISSDAFQGEGKLHISRSVQVEVEVAQTRVFLSGSLSLSLVHKN